MNEIEISEDKNSIIKKHNELVNKARYSLSDNAIKLASMIIAMIKKDDETFQEYYIKVSEFTKLKGSKSKNDYASVRNTIEELLSCPVRIGNLHANFIASGEYKDGEAIAVFEVSQKMKPFLLNLQKDFLEYNIHDILSLKSGYVIRFYELVVQQFNQYKHYNKTAKSFTFDLDVEEMKTLFDIPKSQLYGDIKRSIIEKAKVQFKEKTNISFDYEEYKIGRKVARIKITVKDNTKGTNDHLRSLRAFIRMLRKDFVNVDIFHVKGKQCISINSELKLYDKYQKELIDNKRSMEIYEKLYELAKKDELECLKK